jgi:hypothetical protein
MEWREGDAAAYGETTVWLLAASPSWLHRRVETVQILDLRVVRRRISLDVELRDLPDGLRKTPLLPLGLFDKGKLQNLSCADAEGRALPVATRAQGRLVEIEALMFFAESVALENGLPFDEVRCRQAFTRLVDGGIGEALAYFRMWRRFGSSPDSGSQLLAMLAEDEGFALFAELFATQFVLFAWFPEWGDCRSVVKYSHDAAFEGAVSKADRMAGVITYTLPAEVGLSPALHVRARVVAGSPGDLEVAEFDRAVPCGALTEVYLPEGEVDEIDLLAAARSPEFDVFVQVRMIGEGGKVTRAAHLIAAATTVALVLVAASWDEAHSGDGAAQIVATLFVLGPTFAFGFVARAEDHGVTRFALGTVRSLGWLSSLSGLAAVGVLAGIIGAWALAASACVSGSAFAALSWIALRRRHLRHVELSTWPAVVAQGADTGDRVKS